MVEERNNVAIIWSVCNTIVRLSHLLSINSGSIISHMQGRKNSIEMRETLKVMFKEIYIAAYVERAILSPYTPRYEVQLLIPRVTFESPLLSNVLVQFWQASLRGACEVSPYDPEVSIDFTKRRMLQQTCAFRLNPA